MKDYKKAIDEINEKIKLNKTLNIRDKIIISINENIDLEEIDYMIASSLLNPIEYSPAKVGESLIIFTQKETYKVNTFEGERNIKMGVPAYISFEKPLGIYNQKCLLNLIRNYENNKITFNELSNLFNKTKIFYEWMTYPKYEAQSFEDLHIDEEAIIILDSEMIILTLDEKEEPLLYKFDNKQFREMDLSYVEIPFL